MKHTNGIDILALEKIALGDSISIINTIYATIKMDSQKNQLLSSGLLCNSHY